MDIGPGISCTWIYSQPRSHNRMKSFYPSPLQSEALTPWRFFPQAQLLQIDPEQLIIDFVEAIYVSLHRPFCPDSSSAYVLIVIF